MTMGLKPMKQLGVSVVLCVLLLLTCALLLPRAPHAPTHSSTPSMRPFTDPHGNVITRNRALLGSLTRNAPIGYPPPPAMTSPSPPPY